MTFQQLIEQPQSKKITVLEIDSPISNQKWINYQPGIWFTRLTPGDQFILDDRGNMWYWEGQNTEYYNIQSFAVDGELYGEVSTLPLLISTNKAWYYDSATTDLYIHLDLWNPPELYNLITPGAAIGFTNQIDNTTDNYFEDVYYESRIVSIPNLSKKKDSLFFGILQYQGGTVTLNNADGFFDDFAQLDLYGQPARIKLSFEGLPFSEQLIVYTGKVEEFAHDFVNFKIKISDIRKTLSRSLPVNTLSLTDYPDMKDKLDGTPIPIAFGPVINARAYKVTNTGGVETFVFCDETFNNVDVGISVIDKDNNSVVVVQSGGTFTTSSTEDDLYVSFSQSTVTNGLDVIANILENYEGIAFSSLNYDLIEWSAEKTNVSDIGIWIGKGNIKTAVDIIEQVCADNQGIFDVLASGLFTFRTFDQNRESAADITEDDLVLKDPSIAYSSKEFLSSAMVEYSKDYKEKDPEVYTNLTYQDEVYARYRQYKEKTFKTALTNETDAIKLSEAVMDLSKFIFPTISLTTKTQYIDLRILDNITYEYKRQNGKIVLPNSLFQVLSIALNLSTYEISFAIKAIKEVIADTPAVPDYIFTLGSKTIPAGNYKLTPDGKRKIAIISRTEA